MPRGAAVVYPKDAGTILHMGDVFPGATVVEAAYGSGGSSFQVLMRHILPNSLTAVFAVAALQFGLAILQLATLGFLGPNGII